VTTKDDIREWLEMGKLRQATHVIVVCDDFYYEDYPVYVFPNENARQKVRDKYSGQNMQRTMEVYKLSDDWEIQLNETRCFHY
jgi:hypothetical protein